MPKRPDNPNQFAFSFIPELIPQGDGSFMVRPGKPIEKLTINQAAQRAGLSWSTVKRLLEAGFLLGEHPSPRKYLIYSESLEEHLKRSRSGEMWSDEDRAKYRAKI